MTEGERERWRDGETGGLRDTGTEGRVGGGNVGKREGVEGVKVGKCEG